MGHDEVPVLVGEGDHLQWDVEDVAHAPRHLEVVLPRALVPVVAEVFLEPDLEVKGDAVVARRLEKGEGDAAVDAAAEEDSDLQAFAPVRLGGLAEAEEVGGGHEGFRGTGWGVVRGRGRRGGGGRRRGCDVSEHDGSGGGRDGGDAVVAGPRRGPRRARDKRVARDALNRDERRRPRARVPTRAGARGGGESPRSAAVRAHDRAISRTERAPDRPESPGSAARAHIARVRRADG